MSRSPLATAGPLIALMGVYAAWVLVRTLRSGRSGAWHRDTSPVNFWLHMAITALLIILCLSTLLLVVPHGGPRRPGPERAGDAPGDRPGRPEGLDSTGRFGRFSAPRATGCEIVGYGCSRA